MATYTYRPLKDSLHDIRIVEILPGSFDDEIRLRISHKSLAGVQSAAPQPPVDVDAIRSTLPPGWNVGAVSEEWDHRVLFQDLRLTTADDRQTHRKTSWDHPDPTFDRSRYCPLDLHPPDVGFESLSYVWGSADESVIAKIVEGSSSFSFPITRNLACAIRYLRSRDMPRTMWIDALCINQEDIEERSVQVQRMAEIYSLANRVVVWLGEHSDNSHNALDLIQRLAEDVLFMKGGTSDITPSYTAFQPDADALRSVQDFIQRPWFSRLWIIQEVALGNRWTILQCGSTSISRRVFNSAMLYLGHRVGSFPVPVQASQFRGQFQHGFDPATRLGVFSELIRKYRYQGCANPRDKVYAILGIVREEFRSRIRPDYSSSVAKVYQEAVIAELRTSHVLNILNECILKDYNLDDGASWVPDWSRTVRLMFTQASPTFCCGTSVAWAEPRHHNILECQGASYEAIDFVGQGIPFTRGVETNKLVVTVLVDFLVNRYPSDPLYSGILRDVAIASCFGWTRERFFTDPGSLKLNEVTKWLTAAVHRSSKIPNNATEDLYLDGTTFFEMNTYISAFLCGRSLFFTTSGSVGVGPPGMQIGDEVCILLGCDYPMILRADSGDKYRVVGSSFVVGLEDTKHLLGPLPDFVAPCVQTIGGRKTLSFYDHNARKWIDDPRLPALDDWELLDQDVVDPSPYAVPQYKHKETGEIIRGHPHMTPEALRARGHNIKTLSLI